MNIKSILTFTTTGLVGFAAYGFPIAAPGTEGNAVVTAGGNAVVATYEGNSAGYSNDLYLELDGLGNPGVDGNHSNDLFLFNNHGNSPGDTAAVGTFAAGLELIFRLHVNNTGEDFYSGASSRNADGLPHARVQDNWTPGTTLVSFEDLLNTPEGVNGYNDLSFSFSNTRSQSVPDGISTGLMLGLSLIGMAAAARRAKA